MWAIDLIKEGGFIMGPLIICSILVWAVAIERWFFLKKFKKQCLTIYNASLPLVEQKNWEQLKGYGQNFNPLIHGVYEALLKFNLNDSSWENAIERKFLETQHGLRKYLWILGTIGNLAPFIGLFGTVIGIIKSFESISQSGKSGFNVVSAGLAEALIATAAGIIVAVVSVTFFNFFQTMIKGIFLQFKNRVEELRDSISGNR